MKPIRSQVHVVQDLIRAQTVEIARLRYAVADLEAQHSREYNRARECETAIASALERASKARDARSAAMSMESELSRVPKCGTCRDGAKPLHQVSCTACGRGCLNIDVDPRNGKPWPKRKRTKNKRSSDEEIE